MAALTTPVFDEAVKRLLPFLRSREDREAELTPVLSQNRFSVPSTGTPRLKAFTVDLVERLSHDELIAILKRLCVGADQRSAIEDLCASH